MAQQLAQEAYKATDSKKQESPGPQAQGQESPVKEDEKPDKKDDIIDADFTAVNSGS
jgi:hypothetical protein